ncbi:sensor histidine kinase [Donghicola mangrovi]|uniref:histidine kinase n=1 Tax=Donghicola mangrovi TaxID=2729614 RepID=A0A850QFX3_9RHOB|nr:HAMP domain-containing sensor histidine kinase [Donghicola mangrovi]NVO24979.1 HAMP domain-containing histidine kinase [Donghicola mangrovi]
MTLERPIPQDARAERVVYNTTAPVLLDTASSEQRAERQRVMGELASDVVHDINNLLAAVEAISRLLDMHIEDDNLGALVRRLSRSANTGRIMTRRLLDYVHDDGNGCEPVDLAEIVEGELELLDHIVSRQITLKIDTQDSDTKVMVDPIRVRSALFNMVANARDAIKGAGEITIRQYVVPAVGDQPMCQVLVVADTGCGMSPEVLERVGQRYFTTKGRGKGSGLGVSSVIGLAEDVGGHVEIESTEGKGTRVRLVIPCI